MKIDGNYLLFNSVKNKLVQLMPFTQACHFKEIIQGVHVRRARWGERKGACYIGEGQNGSNCTPYCSHAALALCSVLYALCWEHEPGNSTPSTLRKINRHRKSCCGFSKLICLDLVVPNTVVSCQGVYIH